jgi:hypothetical protein
MTTPRPRWLVVLGPAASLLVVLTGGVIWYTTPPSQPIERPAAAARKPSSASGAGARPSGQWQAPRSTSTKGTIRVSSRPPGTVTVDRGPARTIPVDGALDLVLSVGAHNVSIVSPEGQRHMSRVHIQPGDDRTLCWDFVANGHCP